MSREKLGEVDSYLSSSGPFNSLFHLMHLCLFIRFISLCVKCSYKCYLLGAICLLVVSSAVTMAVPFCLGKVIDLMYTSDPVKMRDNLNTLCLTLVGIFLLGGLCNFGRVYLMSISGLYIVFHLYNLKYIVRAP